MWMQTLIGRTPSSMGAVTHIELSHVGSCNSISNEFVPCHPSLSSVVSTMMLAFWIEQSETCWQSAFFSHSLSLSLHFSQFALWKQTTNSCSFAQHITCISAKQSECGVSHAITINIPLQFSLWHFSSVPNWYNSVDLMMSDSLASVCRLEKSLFRADEFLFLSHASLSTSQRLFNCTQWMLRRQSLWLGCG